MKWIFYCLLLGNLGYLGYHLALAPATEEETVQVSAGTPVDVPGLRLLSEETGRSDRELEAEQVLTNPITPDSSGDDQTDESEEVAVVETADGDASLVEADFCENIGPFEQIVSAQDVSERLNAIGFASELRAVDEPTGEYDYRVVLPPLPSLQEAFRRLRELKSRDIDSYVISEGEDAQGISLGVFSTREAAARHQELLRAEGYSTLMREITRLTRSYWIYGDQGVAYPDEMLAEVKAENPDIQVTKSACLN